MDKEKKKLDKLAKDIRHHSHMYYVKCMPEITDSEFDEMLDELLAIEDKHPEWVEPDSPSQRVGAELSGEFKVVHHKRPMLSLAKVNNEKDLFKWLGGAVKKEADYVREKHMAAMKRERAFEVIKELVSGGVEEMKRDHFPRCLKCYFAREVWDNKIFSIGMKHGVILALIDVFDLTEEEIKQKLDLK